MIGVGGLGHLAVQILPALTPATVIAVDTNEAALTVASDVGAQRTVLAGDGEPGAEIMALTGGLGADAVFDFVGADDTLQLGAGVSRTLGHLTIVGIAGGTLPVGFFNLPNGLSVASSNWGSLPELGEVLALARTGDVRAHVERFTLADAASAYDRMPRAHARRTAPSSYPTSGDARRRRLHERTRPARHRPSPSGARRTSRGGRAAASTWHRSVSRWSGWSRVRRDRDALERVHDTRYLNALEQFVADGGGSLDPDTVASPGSWDTTVAAAGAGLVAIDALREGAADSAFVVARPPGHHTPRRPARWASA